MLYNNAITLIRQSLPQSGSVILCHERALVMNVAGHKYADSANTCWIPGARIKGRVSGRSAFCIYIAMVM